ncbi:uncharacterized protein LOC116299799 [Actinia tenebrosa]|uniref:Uncharacterized protein LOC116299799 n=1 Tax=Actinia tenebrosa TaxID=6105 RepID=A0A6P8IEL6_ACTTE|nr:uncharacterized protein LOC116299799 [Actinia tenebrosa]XP_031564377.1 uncharacterized protein LOC116299799 [Actinia tenebrosa]XP_031564385.1 uncharacterized protein LOC116299799 [Actinia tenebrosa]XP_031564392.1 uncharacterized protein LOC116299799 [Actinia tenebrosa]
MFLFNLSSLEIGLLAGGGAVLLAVIVVLIVVLCRQCGNKGKSISKSPRNKRRLCKSGHHHHSTIDLPPLVCMEGTGCSRSNLMGMIENPLKSLNTDKESLAEGYAVSTLNGPEWKTFDTLGVPRSPREFMYYMRTLERSRANSTPAATKKENTAEKDAGVYDVKIFSSSYRESSSRNGKDQVKSSETSQQGRNTSGALRHPAYRELMQGNTFHVVCTTPCTDMSDSDSEPEFSSPKARLKFTTILEQQPGSTASALNVISRTELHPTYHESKHAIANLELV